MQIAEDERDREKIPRNTTVFPAQMKNEEIINANQAAAAA